MLWDKSLPLGHRGQFESLGAQSFRGAHFLDHEALKWKFKVGHPITKEKPPSKTIKQTSLVGKGQG